MSAAVDILKESAKSAVYRLTGNGVVLKRRQTSLPIAGLQYHGVWPADDRRFTWLSLEDSGGQQFSPDNERHRLLVSRYVAALHVSSGNLAGDGLPDPNPAHYLGVHSARESLLQHAGPDREMLNAIVRESDRIEADWDGIGQCGQALPDAVVHCDLRPKNFHIRGNNDVFLLDWEYAGWGSPATDVAFLGARDYWDCISDRAPAPTLERIFRVQKAGEIFQWLSAVSWASMSLQDDSAKAMGRMRSYAGNCTEWQQ